MIWLWVALGLWACFITYRAYGELRGAQTVQGLFRAYQPPFQADVGWVIDPRETSLGHELALRYSGSQSQLGRRPDGRDTTWQSALKALALKPVEVGSSASLQRPSLRFIEGRSTPDLWIGRYGEKHVVFRQGLGVVVMQTLPIAQRTLTLTQAVVRPW